MKEIVPITADFLIRVLEDPKFLANLERCKELQSEKGIESVFHVSRGLYSQDYIIGDVHQGTHNKSVKNISDVMKESMDHFCLLGELTHFCSIS